MTEPREAPSATSDGERHAGWLELFFDLVFVAVVAQLSHTLHGDPNARDFAVFLGLYFPPWWAWVNLTMAANLFPDDSARRRLLMLTAMLSLAVMATAVPEADGGRAPAYALGYAGTRLVLLGLWWPTTHPGDPGAYRVPRWRPLTYCLASAAGWAASTATPAPTRYIMWAVLLAVEIVLLLSGRGLGLPGRLHAGHLVERVGLVVIIVLGESVLALITSTDQHWTAAAGVTALLGFLLLAALWWSYFDFATVSAEQVLAATEPRRAASLAVDVAGFLHFFVTGAVICMAAGLATAIEETAAGHAHLSHGAVLALAGGLALYHAAHAAIALRYGRAVGSVAPWALPGIGIPIAVIAAAPYLTPRTVVLLLAAEAVAHLLYARAVTSRRTRHTAHPG
ncbi:low temperature requirement protein A [Streptomyces sp. TLI_105]|uniref:low temperature requirement protein A n=1 Tax=Streptomyces sp. TLI_105 TaxID=1881019 RepID=UPI00089A9880|nr:low temperature requirement protein A [Streptomyces sp. TLI_105]SEB79071.1 Low temperature requirement protein LtrA [Streptomyces sp. TLI_105]